MPQRHRHLPRCSRTSSLHQSNELQRAASWSQCTRQHPLDKDISDKDPIETAPINAPPQLPPLLDRQRPLNSPNAFLSSLRRETKIERTGDGETQNNQNSILNSPLHLLMWPTAAEEEQKSQANLPSTKTQS